MPDNELPPSTTRLAMIREIFAGVLATVVMGLFLLLILRALDRVAGTEFTPIKELLAIVNPTVGLVIGYYFSRVTSEARAERAEASAAAAGRSALESAQARAHAEASLDGTRHRAEEARSALADLVRAVDAAPGAPGAPGGLEARERAGDGPVSLEIALDRARRVLR
jgi:hypothetical protein